MTRSRNNDNIGCLFGDLRFFFKLLVGVWWLRWSRVYHKCRRPGFNPSILPHQSLIGEDALEKEMATYSSILAWEISRTELAEL